MSVWEIYVELIKIRKDLNIVEFLGNYMFQQKKITEKIILSEVFGTCRINNNCWINW